VKGDFGEIVVETPRDRNGSFEPQILAKHQTRFDGFDDTGGGKLPEPLDSSSGLKLSASRS